jgi:hypothetical protein
LHLFEGDETVDCARRVAASNSRYEEGVGVGVGLGLEDVADAEVDEGGGEGLLDWRTEVC